MGLRVGVSGQTVCPAFSKPWVCSPAHHTHTMCIHSTHTPVCACTHICAQTHARVWYQVPPAAVYHLTSLSDAWFQMALGLPTYPVYMVTSPLFYVLLSPPYIATPWKGHKTQVRCMQTPTRDLGNSCYECSPSL